MSLWIETSQFPDSKLGKVPILLFALYHLGQSPNATIAVETLSALRLQKLAAQLWKGLSFPWASHCSNSVFHSNKLYSPLILPPVWKFFPTHAQIMTGTLNLGPPWRSFSESTFPCSRFREACIKEQHWMDGLWILATSPGFERASLVAQMVKNEPAMQENWVLSLGREDLLEKGMGTHSSVLAWRIPWTEEADRLQSMGLQSVRHDWETNTFWHFIT